jgi:MerR family transcriptional regulator, light-induced transcriptional regulator
MHEWGHSAASADLHPALAEGEGDARPVAADADRFPDILVDELLPRLIAKPRVAAAQAAHPTLRADPDALARCVVGGRLAQARAWLEARRRSGATALSLMVEDIAPAARRLGDFWRSDDCDFFAVTFAAGALGALLREVAPGADTQISPRAPSAILTLAPGETHELGADLAANVFRLSGWRVERCECGDLARWLAREPFDVAGFSLSCTRNIETLPRAVAQARAASRRRGLTILLGGPVFASRPGLAKRLGADICAADAEVVALPSRLRNALRL